MSVSWINFDSSDVAMTGKGRSHSNGTTAWGKSPHFLQLPQGRPGAVVGITCAVFGVVYREVTTVPFEHFLLPERKPFPVHYDGPLR